MEDNKIDNVRLLYWTEENWDESEETPFNCFDKNNEVRQSKNGRHIYHDGDIIFILFSEASKKRIYLLYKCWVKNSDAEPINDEEATWSGVMILEIVTSYEPNALPLDILIEHGLPKHGKKQLYMPSYIGERISKELYNFLNCYKENYSDEELLLTMNQVEFVQRDYKVYSGKKAKLEPIFINGRREFTRNRATTMGALSNASYRCEIDGAHKTFIRKNSNIPYTEPHHLVPMKYADQFLTSIDVEENIVSLCSSYRTLLA